MKPMLPVVVLSVALVAGNANAQAPTATPKTADIVNPEGRPSVASRPSLRRATPSIRPNDNPESKGVSNLMPSRALGDEPYSSIEPKGTWIGSMGIFKRSLLDKRGTRPRMSSLPNAGNRSSTAQ